VHLVRHDHFPSNDKDDSPIVRPAVVENPMLHANLMALFIEPKIGRSKFTLWQ